jgi:hypothetical protein
MSCEKEENSTANYLSKHGKDKLYVYSGAWSDGSEKAIEVSENPLNPTTLRIDANYYTPSISINLFWETPTGEKDFEVLCIKLDDEHYKLVGYTDNEGQTIVVNYGDYGTYYLYFDRSHNKLYCSRNAINN